MTLETTLKIGVWSMVLVMVSVGLCVAFYVVNSVKNDYLVKTAQVEYYTKLGDNIGKDQTVITKWEAIKK